MNTPLTSLTLSELQDILKQRNLPAFRAKQLMHWLYEQFAVEWDQMANIPRAMKDALADEFPLRQGTIQNQLTTADDTTKFTLAWPDDALSETVLMPSSARNTVCISSQVGCAVGCRFCASGLHGLQRNLTAAEMVEQVLWAQQLLPPGQRISNVVIMGMGEPLANYDHTLKAVAILNASWSLNIGARHITISTVGIPQQIRRLAREPYQVTLALSLHAPDDDLRQELIPWSYNTPINELFAAVKEYYKQTHREVTLEYLLLDGVNTLPRHADALAKLANSTRCNVNLINYNPVSETPFAPPSDKTVTAFMDRLKSRGVNVHLRHSRGQDIRAACGQLRRQDLT